MLRVPLAHFMTSGGKGIQCFAEFFYCSRVGLLSSSLKEGRLYSAAFRVVSVIMFSLVSGRHF